MAPEEYIKLAEVEDRMWYFRALHGHVIDAWRERASGGVEILDAGCGTGGLLLRLRAAFPAARFSGIDFMPLACDLARRRCGPAIEIRQASVTKLPFPDASFDLVSCVDVLSQIEVAAAREGVQELFRVLRPGGIVVTNVPAYMWMWSYHDVNCHTRHRYTRPEVRSLLTGAGFVAPRLTHWNSLPFPLIWAKRKFFSETATSDVKLYPAPIEAAFNGAMAFERAWIRSRANWAWGTSIFGLAQKPA